MKSTNGLGIASMILGIVGVVLSCVLIGVLPALIGLILGIIGICQKGKKKGTSIAGISCSCVAIFIFLIMLFAFQTDENNSSEENVVQEETSNIDAGSEETLESTAVAEIPTPTPTPTPTPEPKYEFTYEKMTVKYLNHEIMVDDVDQTVLVVYYEFTNNSGENQTFDYVFDDTCFQNGVEVEGSWWHANEESKNSEKEIKSGTTITVASSFVLGDSRDDVELEITPWLRDKVLFEMTLQLEEQ